MRQALVTLVVVLAAAAGPAAAAAAGCPKTTLGDVEDEVMCPVCGTPLELATESPQAQRERELIRRLVDDCKSKDEVKAVLTAELGDEVLALPGSDGFDLAAYLVPALAILLAGGAVGMAALRWRRGRSDGSESPERGDGGAPERGDSDATRRLDADLERYDL